MQVSLPLLMRAQVLLKSCCSSSIDNWKGWSSVRPMLWPQFSRAPRAEQGQEPFANDVTLAEREWSLGIKEHAQIVERAFKTVAPRLYCTQYREMLSEKLSERFIKLSENNRQEKKWRVIRTTIPKKRCGLQSKFNDHRLRCLRFDSCYES